jgi:regulator of protease activity HflC (stomatin/prohibitin superfamily)
MKSLILQKKNKNLLFISQKFVHLYRFIIKYLKKMKVLITSICIFAIAYWIIAKIGFSVYQSSNGRNGFKINHSLVLFLILPIVIIVGLSFLTVVPAQNTGVVITPGGVLKESYKTGWHLINPVYKIELMDKTSQVYTCASQRSVPNEEYKEYKAASTQSSTIWAPTVDGIKMGFDISASWRIDEEYAWWIYDNVSEQDGSSAGRFYWLEENVIKPKLKSSLALTVSRYNPVEVYSNKRQAIQDEVLDKMKTDIKAYHLVLDQIDIREVYYNEEYEKAINEKKLQEQKVLALVEVTKQKKEQELQAAIDKNIAILKAEGEAKSLQIKGQSIASNPRIIELEWIQKWDGKLPQTSLGSGQGLIFNLNK